MLRQPQKEKHNNKNEKGIFLNVYYFCTFDFLTLLYKSFLITSNISWSMLPKSWYIWIFVLYYTIIPMGKGSNLNRECKCTIIYIYIHISQSGRIQQACLLLIDPYSELRVLQIKITVKLCPQKRKVVEPEFPLNCRAWDRFRLLTINLMFTSHCL